MKFSKLANLNEDDKDIARGIAACLSKAGIKYYKYKSSLDVEHDGGTFPAVKIAIKKPSSVEIATLAISLTDDGDEVVVNIEDLWTSLDNFQNDMSFFNQIVQKLKSIEKDIKAVFKSDRYTD